MTPFIENEHFEILDEKPTLKYLKELNSPSYFEEIRDGKKYWIIFKTVYGSRLYDYLFSKKDYEAKEKLFGIDDEGNVTIEDGNENYDFIQYKVPKDWILSDKKIKRKLKVIVTDVNQKNDRLLHSIYLKIRSK